MARLRLVHLYYFGEVIFFSYFLMCYTVAPSGGEVVVPVPSMGDSISEGTVVQWTKTAGESVEADDVVVILETDKVRLESYSMLNSCHGHHLNLHNPHLLTKVCFSLPFFSSNKTTWSKPPPSSSPSLFNEHPIDCIVGVECWAIAAILLTAVHTTPLSSEYCHCPQPPRPVNFTFYIL